MLLSSSLPKTHSSEHLVGPTSSHQEISSLPKTHSGECLVGPTSSCTEIKLTPHPSDSPVHLSSAPLPDPFLIPHTQVGKLKPQVLPPHQMQHQPAVPPQDRSWQTWLLAGSLPKAHTSELLVALTFFPCQEIAPPPQTPQPAVSPQDPSLSPSSSLSIPPSFHPRHQQPRLLMTPCPRDNYPPLLHHALCPTMGLSDRGPPTFSFLRSSSDEKGVNKPSQTLVSTPVPPLERSRNNPAPSSLLLNQQGSITTSKEQDERWHIFS